MAIRSAGLEDAAAISALIRELAEKYITPEFSPEGRAQLLDSLGEPSILDYLRQGFRYHVYEENGELLGVVATRGDSHLFNLFVSDKARGRGIARALWETALQECLAAGAQGPFSVNSSRFAVGLYEKFGFRRIGDETCVRGIVSVPMRLELGSDR